MAMAPKTRLNLKTQKIIEVADFEFKVPNRVPSV